MDVLSKFLSSKVEFISSSLYSIMLWTVNLPLLPLKNPKQFPPPRSQQNLQLGLQTLIHPEAKQTPPDPAYGPSIVHCYTLATAWKRASQPPPSSSSSLSMFRSSVTDDLIGTESGDYMSSNVEDLKGVMDKAEPHYNRSRPRYRRATTRQYPPPIPLLTQTGSLPGRMPWVFKREYVDGRLIIRAESVKRHEYLEAHRENGRLTMKLVPVDHIVYCEECGHRIMEDEEEELEDLNFNQQVKEEHPDDDDDDEDVEGGLGCEGSLSQKTRGNNETEPYVDLRKCVGYGDGLVQDSDPFWKGNGIEGADGYVGRPGSGPLRAMTTVM